MMERLSYIIPFCNSKDTIKDTLESIVQDGGFSEIILVDDASTDETKDVVNDYLSKFKNITYVRNEERLGAGLSRNRGAQASNGNILVFVDADITIPTGTSNIVKKYFGKLNSNERPDVLVANRARECLYKDPISMYKNYWTSYNFSKMEGWTSFLCSSFFAVRKDVFAKVGGFRNLRQIEDNDLGYRLSLNKFKIYFANEIIVAHKKKFTLSSLLKREFIAGKEGIKLKIRRKRLGDLVKEKKFFAVNKNFLYSFPLSLLFSLGFILSIALRDLLSLGISIVAFLLITILNRDFLSYASCNEDKKKEAYYCFLMIAQMHAIGLGMVEGILELITDFLLRQASLIINKLISVCKLFTKNTFGPEQVTFFVTDRCNLKCDHCFVNKNIEKDELTVDEYKQLSKKMGRVSYVTVTGGEPFLRDDIDSVIKVLNLNLKPSLITILTSGYQTDLIETKLIDVLTHCPDQNFLVKISIDGPEDVHDRMRGAKGAFQNACNTFMRLKGLKKVYSNLSLGIITTYTKDNKDVIEKAEDIVLKMEPDQYGLVLQRKQKANELNEEIVIDEYLKAFERINGKMLSRTKGFFRKFRLAYKNRMRDKLKEIYANKAYPMKCFAGSLNAVIAPAGNVFACEQLDGRLGSLRAANFNWKMLWRSNQAKDLRKFIKSKKCYCTNECYLPFNLSYDIVELLKTLKVFIKQISFKRGKK